MKRINTLVSAAVAVTLLSACGTSHLSKDITPEGWVNGDIVFPDKGSATLKEGIFPNPAGLKVLGSGVTKKQVLALIGPPHFREGVFAVREWDYIFNFRGTGGKYATCQYKIVYSKDGEAQSFFPSPEVCATALADYEVTPEEADQILGKVSITEPEPESSFDLQTDALFDFDSATLSAAGAESVKAIASKIKSTSYVNRVRVEGHTDRIGSRVYNNGLSERRAAAVRDVLVAEGLGGMVETAGRGMDVPKMQCADQPRQALIACLAPNRRVVIAAYTSQ